MSISFILAIALLACAALGTRLGFAAHHVRVALLSGLAAFAVVAVAPALIGGVAALSTAIALLTLGIGVTVLGFSERYLRADINRNGFASNVLLLLASVLALAATTNIVALVLAWMASGWVMVALIGHVRDWDEARAAQRRALASFAIGDIALIAAAGLIVWQSGETELGAALAGIASGDPVALVAALLLVVAAMARCALPPFSKWLTRSMTAPTPVSALMHAGFVNAGGLLLIRFGPLLEAAPVAQWLAIGAGAGAALWGTGIMLVRPDIKRSLAGSTIAQMGFMLMSCGLAAYAAALWHLIAHGLFKAWLFLSSGSAVGARVGPAPAPSSAAGLAIASLAGAATGAVLLTGDAPAAAALTLALAVTTAGASLSALRSAPALVPTLVAVVALYAAGVMLAERILATPYGNAPAGWPLILGLFTLLATAWIAHAHLRRTGRTLPVALYARLLNS